MQSTTKPEEIFLRRMDERIPKIDNLISLNNRELMYSFLEKDYAEAIAAHETSILQYMKDYDAGYRILEDPLMTVGIGVAFARNDTRGICGMLEVAEYYANDLDKQAECRAKIKDSSHLLLEFINEVLDMGKLESGEIQLEHQPFKESREGEFDAILMDMMMPEMDGYQATEAIRAMDREDAGGIPIIAMTANAFTEDRIKAQEAGMNVHVSKPIDPDKLIKVLYKLVSSGVILPSDSHKE